MAKDNKAAPNVALLDNWIKLNGALMKLSEEQVAALLEHEKKNRNRLTFTLRLLSRLSKLRRDRERRAIARSAGKVL